MLINGRIKYNISQVIFRLF